MLNSEAWPWVRSDDLTKKNKRDLFNLRMDGFYPRPRRNGGNDSNGRDDGSGD